MTHISEFNWKDGGLNVLQGKVFTAPADPESDSLAILIGKPTRAELEQRIEDMKREVQFWKQMVDDVAEDYERELEKAERDREVDTEAVADAIADILAGYYRALSEHTLHTHNDTDRKKACA